MHGIMETRHARDKACQRQLRHTKSKVYKRQDISKKIHTRGKAYQKQDQRRGMPEKIYPRDKETIDTRSACIPDTIYTRCWAYQRHDIP